MMRSTQSHQTTLDKMTYFDSCVKKDALLKGGFGQGYGPAVYSNIGQNDE